MTRTESHTRHALIESLLEQLPPLPAVVQLRRELLQQANAALARHDTKQLDKLYHDVQLLARSLGIESGGRISRRAAPGEKESGSTVESASAPAVHNSRDAGPGRSGWSPPLLRRVTYSAPRGENAPLEYPWGDPPARVPKAAPQRLPATLAARTIPDEEPKRPRWRVSPAARKWIRPRTPAQWEREQREWRELGRTMHR